MHAIQRGILKRLTLRDNLSYSELKTQGVESNRFVYHLNEVIKLGYIRKDAFGYRLTSIGKRYADRVNLEQFSERVQPKIVTLIACKNRQGRYLLYRRKRQPFRNKIGFPYGKVHIGEKIAEAAERELLEKTGLRAKLIHRGDVYISVFENKEVITHMLAHIFVASHITGQLKTQSPIGECFWESPANISLQDEIPGWRQIVRELDRSKNRFFAEYFLDVAL